MKKHEKTIVFDGQNEDPVKFMEGLINSGRANHGYATAKMDHEFSQPIGMVKEGDRFTITAWLPDQDITCIWCRQLMLRLDVESFNKYFRKSTGL